MINISSIENDLETVPDDELGYSKYNKNKTTAATATTARRCIPVLEK